MDEFSICKDGDEILIRVWSDGGTETTSCSIEELIEDIEPELKKFGYAIIKTTKSTK